MADRHELERDEDARLAPYAQRSADATRRYPIENDGRQFDYRTAFQRDRDRVVYSRAFRRLRQKAQAGLLPAYEDHRRNRLTHTLEVTQLARTIGRALRLNEDLVEAVALAHDLGQPPFGAHGEAALDDLLAGRLDGRGGPGFGDLGGFSHGWQGLRVIDRLEKRYDHAGLNLTDEVREGVLKLTDRGRTIPEPLEGIRAGCAPLLEVQAVGMADRIASALHDLDDGMQSGAVDPQRVERLAAVRELRRKLGAGWRARAGRFVKANLIHRGLTHLLVTGTILESRRRLAGWAEHSGIASYADYRERRDDALAGDELRLPAASRKMLEDVEGFLEREVRRGREADRVEARGRRVLLGLFAAYHADPKLLEDHALLRLKEALGGRFLRDLGGEPAERCAERYRADPRGARILADYLAGMTDAYAIVEHRRLLEMGAVPIPSAEQLQRERPSATRGIMPE